MMVFPQHHSSFVSSGSRTSYLPSCLFMQALAMESPALSRLKLKGELGIWQGMWRNSSEGEAAGFPFAKRETPPSSPLNKLWMLPHLGSAGKPHRYAAQPLWFLYGFIFWINDLKSTMTIFPFSKVDYLLCLLRCHFEESYKRTEIYTYSWPMSFDIILNLYLIRIFFTLVMTVAKWLWLICGLISRERKKDRGKWLIASASMSLFVLI